MKLADRLYDDGDKIIHKRTFDPNPTIAEVRSLKDTTAKTGDMWHVGRIPSWMIGEWAKEAGLQMHDTQAMQDLIKRKLMSGEFNALRPHEGTF